MFVIQVMMPAGYIRNNNLQYDAQSKQVVPGIHHQDGIKCGILGHCTVNMI